MGTRFKNQTEIKKLDLKLIKLITSCHFLDSYVEYKDGTKFYIKEAVGDLHSIEKLLKDYKIEYEVDWYDYKNSIISKEISFKEYMQLRENFLITIK